MFKAPVTGNQQLIMSLICQINRVSWKGLRPLPGELLNQLMAFEKEDLITIEEEGLAITAAGKPFVRNICAAFDPYMQSNKKAQPLFSKAI